MSLFLQESLDAKGQQISDAGGADLIIAFFERETGLKFDPVYLPWKRAQLMVLGGNGIIWGFSKTPERLKNYRFSETVMGSNIWGIAYGEPQIYLRNLADLQGKTVSVERGVSHGIEFELAKNKIFKVDEDPASAASRFKKLLSKRSDVLLWGVVQFDQQEKLMLYLHNTYIPNMGDSTLLNHKFYTSSAPLFYDSLHFASAKGSFEAEMKKIDLAIRKGVKSGELAQIAKQLE